MSAQAVQLLGRIEHELLHAQTELSELKMDSRDEPTRKMLMRAMLEVKKLRNVLEDLVLDAMDDEDEDEPGARQ